jgi:hypothetical protein
VSLFLDNGVVSLETVPGRAGGVFVRDYREAQSATEEGGAFSPRVGRIRCMELNPYQSPQAPDGGNVPPTKSRLVTYAMVVALLFALAYVALTRAGASPSHPSGVRGSFELGLFAFLGLCVSLVVALVAFVIRIRA